MESFVTLTNIKALAVSAIVLLFTYWYYAGKEPSFLSMGTMAAFWGLAVVALIGGALLFKGVSYAMAGVGAYPHLLFRFLFPLLVLLLLFWLIWSVSSLSAFDNVQAYTTLLKGFCSKHLPYILIVSVIIGAALSIPAPSEVAAIGYSGHLKVAVGLVLGILLCVLIMYPVKRISQPALPPQFAAVPNLDGLVTTETHEVRKLLNAGPDMLISEPWQVMDTGDVIINELYQSSNKKMMIQRSYRIGKSGEVTDSLSIDELHPKNDLWEFENGIIRALESKQAVTWVFDQNRTSVGGQETTAHSTRKVTPLAHDTGSLKIEFFYKTGAFHCEARPDLQWNGTRYYTIVHHDDTIRFKIDDVYALQYNGKDCRERTVEYFTAPGLNYALLCVDHRAYFVIRPVRK